MITLFKIITHNSHKSQKGLLLILPYSDKRKQVTNHPNLKKNDVLRLDLAYSTSIPSFEHYKHSSCWKIFNPKTAGGGGVESTPPLDIFRDHSAARIFLTAPLADFLLSSLAHLMTPFSRKSGIPLRRCTTFYTSSPDQKWLKNVILCTKSMQMEFSHLIHKDMIIFTFIGWNQFILA